MSLSSSLTTTHPLLEKVKIMIEQFKLDMNIEITTMEREVLLTIKYFNIGTNTKNIEKLRLECVRNLMVEHFNLDKQLEKIYKQYTEQYASLLKSSILINSSLSNDQTNSLSSKIACLHSIDTLNRLLKNCETADSNLVERYIIDSRLIIEKTIYHKKLFLQRLMLDIKLTIPEVDAREFINNHYNFRDMITNNYHERINKLT